MISIMAIRRKKRPRDPIQLAKLIGDIATGQADDCMEDGKMLLRQSWVAWEALKAVRHGPRS